jgi:quercetin 2,3-dioxygenase
MLSTNTHTIHDRNLRGHSKIDWLDSWHTFSFSNFQDPNRMGFRLPPVGYANAPSN